MRLVNLQSIMSRRMTAFHAPSGVFSSRDVRLTASCGSLTPCPSCKTDLKPPGLSGCEHPQDPPTMLFRSSRTRASDCGQKLNPLRKISLVVLENLRCLPLRVWVARELPCACIQWGGSSTAKLRRFSSYLNTL
jgi:hypothetical protein